MPTRRTYILGKHSHIDANVTLGHTFRGWSKPLVIGDHAIVHTGSLIYADTVIGKRFTCGHNVVIRAENSIGDRVVVFHQCTIEGRVRIGNGVKIMAHVYMPTKTVIEDFVFIGPGVTLLNHKYPMIIDCPTAGVTIRSRACIGGGSTLCPGVTVGEGAFVGAGTLVNKDVPPNTLAYGVPVRFQPMPEQFAGGTKPELVMVGSDVWDPQVGDDWTLDYPELAARSKKRG